MKFGKIFSSMIGIVILAGAVLAPQESQLPYSRLYDELLALEKKGELEAALRLVPKIYAAEIPVDKFYGTLDQKRTDLLVRLMGRESFKIEGAAYGFGDLQQIFEILLTRPDVLNQRFPALKDLSPSRFFYAMVTAGRNPRPGSQAAVRPDLDIRQALASADPWLVSAALFLARKGEASLASEDVLRRWQSRIDLWDAECTTQALLFLASHPAETLAKIKVANPDVEREISYLEKIDSGQCQLQVLPFWRNFRPAVETRWAAGLAGLKLQSLRADGTPAGERVLEERGSIPLLISIAPGSFKLRYVQGSAGPAGEYAGVYGESTTFRAEKGKFIRIAFAVIPGV